MTRTIVRCYDRVEDAKAMVRKIELHGLKEDKISIIIGCKVFTPATPENSAEIDTFDYCKSDILSNLRKIEVPNVDVFTIGGQLLPISGGVTLNLIENFLLLGIEERDASFFSETLRRGGIAVVVVVDEALEFLIRSEFDNSGSIDEEARITEYKREGWVYFGAHSGPYRSPSSSELMH